MDCISYFFNFALEDGTPIVIAPGGVGDDSGDYSVRTIGAATRYDCGAFRRLPPGISEEELADQIKHLAELKRRSDTLQKLTTYMTPEYVKKRGEGIEHFDGYFKAICQVSCMTDREIEGLKTHYWATYAQDYPSAHDAETYGSTWLSRVTAEVRKFGGP